MMRKIITALACLLLLVSFEAFGQHPNDDCTTAGNLGSLPVPQSCTTGPVLTRGIGAPDTFNLNNNLAGAATPYVFMTGCQTIPNAMPSPSADVWYQFTVTGNVLNIDLTGLNTPNIGLWEGVCGSLVGRGCAVGAAGNVSATFNGLIPGTTYYLQIAGADTFDTGPFRLIMSNDFDCNICVTQATLTANPPPTNGTYQPGDTVTFCLDITEFTQVAINWFHGVEISWGAGWQNTAYNLVPSGSCDGFGNWQWYNSVTSTATGNTYGPGFFYDRPGPPATLDGNPGNNYGDNCQTPNVRWLFCWDLVTQDCPPGTQGQDLTVTANTLADGESGGWTSPACAADPDYLISANLTCCVPATSTVTNVSCNGGTDGEIIATASGTGPWDYTWTALPGNVTIRTNSNQAGPDTLSNIAAGTYVVVTLDNFDNCTAVDTIVVTEPPALQIAVDSSFNVSCNGANDGRAYISATGGYPGTSGYTYGWNTSPLPTLGQALVGVGPGTYTGVVLDSNLCVDSIQVTITEPPAIVITIDSFFDVSCNGFSDGRAYASAIGGTGTLSYSWNTTPAQNTAAATNLPVGTWTVTVTDANNCTNTAQVTIGEPPLLVAAIDSSFNVQCNGANDGRAYASASGGTAPYSFSWNTTPVQNAAAATNLPPGTWTVTVTDANNCTTTINVNITQPPVVTASIDSSFNATCNGANDGRAYASATGGTGPYSFSWNTTPAQNTASATNLPAGTWTVTVTDMNNCTATAQAVITEPPALNLTPGSTPANCGNQDGQAYVTVAGGTPGYNYVWATFPIQLTDTAQNVSAGTYLVVVQDANGCLDSVSATVADIPGAVAAIDSSFDATCNGLANGRAYASAIGGTGPYSYSWNTTPVQTTASVANLPVGTWTVTVTDANNCTSSAQTTIAEPTALNLTPGSNPSTCGFNDGQAYVSASGGTPGYGYSWNTTPIQLTDTAQNVAAGAYQVVVTDANGCQDSATVNVTDLGSPVAAIDSFFNASCSGVNDGRAYASASGGTTPYSFSWNTTPAQNTAAATGLGPGTYTVTVSDANNCTATAQVTLSAPSGVVIAVDSFFDATCNGADDGRGYVSASGGTPAYVFGWNTNPPTIGPAATGLAPGTYTAIAADQNGCIDSISVTIAEPSAVAAAIDSSINVTCNGFNNGRAVASASGGTPGYAYTWNTSPSQAGTRATGLGPGTYTVVVTDNNGCMDSVSTQITEPPALSLTPGSNPSTCGNNDGQAFVSVTGGTAGYTYSWPGTNPIQTTDTAQNVAAGSYTVIVTDQNGCIDSTVAQVIDQGSPVVSVDSFFNVTCFGLSDGSSYASATGGTGTLSFSWNTTPAQTGMVATNLPAGNFIVTVTDGNNCTSSANVTITEPPALVPLIDSVRDASCNGGNDGAAFASASGGTTPYTFAWNTNPIQTTAQASNLNAGTYQVIVTDSNGCMDSVTAVVNEPTVVVAVVDSVQDVLCSGNSDGSLFASGSGGTGPYSFSWNTNPVQTTQNASGVPIGTFVVTVTDANGCTAIDSGTVNEPLPLSLPTTKTPATCGNQDGSATVTPSGGTGSYTYSWNTTPVQTTATASNLPSGSYIVTVTDANGCQDTAQVTVVDLGAPTVSITFSEDVSCNGLSDGSAFAQGQGGTGTLNYSWSTSPAQTTDSAVGLTAGTYTVLVSDSAGCVDSATVTITEPDPLQLDGFSTLHHLFR